MHRPQLVKDLAGYGVVCLILLNSIVTVQMRAQCHFSLSHLPRDWRFENSS